MTTWRTADQYRFESEIQADVMLAFGAVPYMRIWRNNVAVAYPVSQVMRLLDDIKRAMRCLSWKMLKEALVNFKKVRPVKFSIPGSGDTFFILTGDPITGKNRGRFGNIEFKMLGRKLDPDQVTWRKMFVERGGIYIIANCVEDVRRGLIAEGVEL